MSFDPVAEKNILEVLNNLSIEFLKKAIDMSFESESSVKGSLAKVKHDFEELEKRQRDLIVSESLLPKYVIDAEKVMDDLYSVQNELFSSNLERNLLRIVVALCDLIEKVLKMELLDFFYKPVFLTKCRNDLVEIADRFNSLDTDQSLSYYAVQLDEIMILLLELQKKVIQPPVKTVIRDE